MLDNVTLGGVAGTVVIFIAGVANLYTVLALTDKLWIEYHLRKTRNVSTEEAREYTALLLLAGKHSIAALVNPETNAPPHEPILPKAGVAFAFATICSLSVSGLDALLNPFHPNSIFLAAVITILGSLTFLTLKFTVFAYKRWRIPSATVSLHADALKQDTFPEYTPLFQ